MLVAEVNTRFDSQLSRMNCQMFSNGFNSGERGGSSRMLMLSGMTISSLVCHPA
jgi:hypothetical protein